MRSRIFGAMVLVGTASLMTACGGAQTESAAPPVQSSELSTELSSYLEENALPRDGFYEAEPTAAPAGAMIRSERFGGWKLPEGATGSRILYNSRSTAGQPVVASAAVVTPAGQPPAGGWPVIAWAHGTSGVGRDCAPTMMKDLYQGDYIAAAVNAGYAVVATDYAGLGAGTEHEYVSTIANANDVRYSVAAARQAVPELGSKWVAVGHSQGGQAVWGVAKQQAVEPVAEFLGAVALAPAAPLDEIGESERRSADPGGAAEGVAYQSFITRSLETQYPEFRPSDVVSEAGMSHYERVVGECLLPAIELSAGTDASQFMRPGWLENPALRDFVGMNVYNDVPLGGPIFVVSGANDLSVPAPAVAKAAAKQCQAGTAVQVTEFPGTHDEIVEQSFADQMRWIGDRFGGVQPAPSNCS